MYLTKIAAVLSLFGALGVGLATVYVADSRQEVAAVTSPEEITATLETQTPLTTESLRGEWIGYWGNTYEGCTLTITDVDGKVFHGYLKTKEAKIAFVGTLEPETRKLFLQETKVVELGGQYSEWSLGKNSAVISADGLTMTGTGSDKWGPYSLEVSREK